MGKDDDLQALLRAVFDEEPADAPEPAATASPFAIQLSAALTEAIETMRAEGMIEIEDDRIEPLVAEVAEAGLDSHSPKHLIKKVIRTLIESDYVDEVYGSDETLSAALRRQLDPEA